MKNTFFLPIGQRFVASNTICLVQFPRGRLGSPDETDLDTAHQTEMAPFRKNKTANNFDLRSPFCAEPIFHGNFVPVRWPIVPPDLIQMPLERPSSPRKILCIKPDESNMKSPEFGFNAALEA